MFSSNQSICNIILIILTSTYSTEGKACAEQRCLNGGTCINNICICTKEWRGDNCEKQVKMECSELEGCNHGGTCVDAVCQCTRLWTGGNCDTNVHDTVFYQGYMTFESHRYSFIPDPFTYSDAQKQCQKLGGRVITEPFSSSKQRALSALVKQYLPETEDSWMWVGRLQGTDKCTTIRPDFATNNSQNSCDNKFSYVCERPLKGACFQEVADEYCSDNEDGYCHQSLSGIVCCKENFKMLANGSCVDINECQTNSELCSFTFGKCDNEPGSYRCLCDEGMQGNGIDSCGYIISLTQLVNYTELTMPAPERKIKNKENRLRDLYNKGLTLKIEKLSFTSITELENKQFNITFNIYSKDKDLTPTALIEDYMKVKLKMLETAPNKLMFVGWEKPKPGSLTCLPTKMGIGDDRFHFHNASANSFSVSKEKCSNGLPQAVVKCNVRKFGDGTEIAFYDYTTLERNPCGTPTSVEEWTTRMKIGGKDEKRDALLSLTEFVNEDKTRKISDAGLKDVVDIADSLLSNDENSETPDTDKKSSEQNKNIGVALSVESLGTRVKLEPNETFRVNSSLIDMQVEQHSIFEKTARNVDFTLGEIKASLPEEAIEQGSSQNSAESIPVSFTVFKNADFFQNDKDVVIDKVFSSSVANTKVENLAKPLWFQMPEIDSRSNNSRQVKSVKCAFFDVNKNEWNSDGCSYVPGSNPPNCTCNHLTCFAVLVKTNKLSDPYALEIFGQVGCALSVIGLILMLACNLYFRSLRKMLTTQIHTNLGFSLLVVYITFLIGIERIEKRNQCIAIAAILQFSLLSTWGWMTVECATMYKKLVSVFGSTGPYYIVKAAIIVYTCSALIVVINVVVTIGWYDNTISSGWVSLENGVAISNPSSYISDRLCWLHEYSLIFGFLVPIGIAFVVNILGFIAITKAITCDRKQIQSSSSQNKTMAEEIKTYLVRAVILMLILGLTWLFAIPLAISDDVTTNIVFGWLFSITNALQGFFLFFLFCIRRKDVRDLWIKELTKPFKKQTQETLSTTAGMRTERSPVHNTRNRQKDFATGNLKTESSKSEGQHLQTSM